jgi:hypothetical protein
MIVNTMRRVLGGAKSTCKTAKSAGESLRVLAGAVRVLAGVEIRLRETVSVLSEA